MPLSDYPSTLGKGAYTLLTASASPQGRECVLVLQVLAYSEADREVAQHILNTFEADCERI